MAMILQLPPIELPVFAGLRMSRVGIHQNRITLCRRPPERFVRTCRHPHRWMGLLQRFGQYFDVFEGEKLPMVGQPLVAPCVQHDVDGFAEVRLTLLRWHAKDPKLSKIEAAPRSPVDPPS